MKLFVGSLLAVAVYAGGGHGHHGRGGGGVAFVAAPRFVVAPRYVTPVHSYVQQPIQRTIIQPVERTIVQQPVQRTIIQPVERTIVQQPVKRTFVQPVQKRMVRTVSAPMEPMYESEEVEEKVFRTPISKTVTELPDEVRRVKKTVNQHFPMIHKQVRDHYTIQDEQEHNIIHHYYEPEERWLGKRSGQKFESTEHVDHPGEMLESSQKFETIQPVMEKYEEKVFMVQEPEMFEETQHLIEPVMKKKFYSLPAQPALRTTTSTKSVRSFTPSYSTLDDSTEMPSMAEIEQYGRMVTDSYPQPSLRSLSSASSRM